MKKTVVWLAVFAVILALSAYGARNQGADSAAETEQTQIESTAE